MDTQGSGFLCGLNAANHFLDNQKAQTKAKITPLTHHDVGGWTSPEKITNALNKKIADVGLSVMWKEVTVNPKKHVALMAQDMLSQLGEDTTSKLENINQFILLRDGHYYVYEKDLNGEWKEWDEKNKEEKIEAEDAISAIFHAFTQAKPIEHASVAIIFPKV